MTANPLIEACGYGQDDLLKLKLTMNMRKKDDLSDSEFDMVVCTTQARLSFPETADLLGLSTADDHHIYGLRGMV